MPEWTVEDVLNFVQELVGEPVGGYYNISSRLKLLNVAHSEMIKLSRSLSSVAEIDVEIGEADYYLPEDFDTFSKESPHLRDTSGTVTDLKVVDLNFMDSVFPGWQEGTSGTPEKLIMVNSQEVKLYPTPSRDYTLVLRYHYVPRTLRDLDDIPFENNDNLNRFAVGLAYFVAGRLLLPAAPQTANHYDALYRAELNKMRNETRVNPQHAQRIRPEGYRR